MSILNFPGPLPVALSFQWESETIANALSKGAARKRHILANESVFEFTVTGTVDGRTTSILHKATPQSRFYDPALNMYTTSPVSGTELERLLDPGSGATFRIDLNFTIYTFFDVLLAQMTRADEDLHNLANPNDSAPILRTFKRQVRDDKILIHYSTATQHIQAVPCRLVDRDVKPQPSPYPPAVKLLFEIDFHNGIDAVRREAMRKLIAMDWSGLARFGKKAPSLPTDVEVWKDNVLLYLANQTDMQRAERFRTTIASRHADKSPRQLAADLRDDIDLYVVTANHWGEAREDAKTERHQALISDLLSTVHQSAWLASPLYLNRELCRIYGLSLDEKAALTLQYGTGHCGEHGCTSFSILRTVMASPGCQIDNIVLCGNANIDHGFVLCNLTVTRAIFTTATSAANTRVAIGQDIRVFNLRDALARNPGGEVFVVDPYLDTSMMRPTAAGLLQALHNNKQQRRGKDTDFLVFQLQFPVPADFTTDDIRTLPVVERMRLIKNV